MTVFTVSRGWYSPRFTSSSLLPDVIVPGSLFAEFRTVDPYDGKVVVPDKGDPFSVGKPCGGLVAIRLSSRLFAAVTFTSALVCMSMI